MNTSSAKIDHLVNMVAATFGLDVGVISDQLCILAGTDAYLQNMGLLAPDDSHAALILASGESKFIKDLPQSKQCYICQKRNACPYVMGLYNPIVIGDKIHGVACLLARNQKQREIMLTRQQQIKEYLTTTVSLISDHLANKGTNKLELLFNSLEDGLLVMNSQGIVQTCNQAAGELLAVSAAEAVGQPIELLIPQFPFLTLVQEKFTQPRQVHLPAYPHLFTMQPIIVEHNPQEYLLLIKNLSSKSNFPGPRTYLTTNFKHIIGSSPGILRLKAQAEKIAQTDSTVLILGETGTGKELLARGIHESSPRKRGPLVTVNCSAIPENLLESELFGYADGAFTGARKGGNPGKFQLSNQGTLFLDEIGELPLLLQAKILRVLEQNTIVRLGSHQSEQVDVRIIAATNQDLKTKSAQGLFRADLYFRLNVIPLHVLPLRERKEDLPTLIALFLNYFAHKYQSPVRKLHPQILSILMAYNWPGNVRELKNIIEYIVNTESAEIATIENLPPDIYAFWTAHRSEIDSSLDQHAKRETFLANAKANQVRQLDKWQADRIAIEEALKIFGTSTQAKKRVAQYLGISLATLYRRLDNG